MDRDARDTFELLDDIETVLGIKTCPVNWPIGSGKEFKGVYDRKTKIVSTFQAISTGGAKKAEETDYHINDEALKALVGPYLFDQFNEEIELIDGATEEMDIEKVRAGELSPVFFGSALNTFGIEQFLNYFLKMTTPPIGRNSSEGIIDPVTEPFSAFVFKIQANMNKAHRDRIAFMRICSGKFEAGMEVYHAASKRKIKLSQPQQLMAQDRKIVDEAYAGDVIGVFDPDGRIDFNHVDFVYKAGSAEDTLKDIDIHIKSGETVGVIGGTGCGKSTFVNLISRLYDVKPDGGSVCVGGHDVRDYDMEVIRNEVAVVLQKNVLFSGTILDNLRWGKEDATEEECREVCELACADEFIDRMPDGYNTWIEQGGSNVSGGQKQRLCIARALLKSPKVLILDDSTSAVDTATDAKIRQAFATKIPNTTKIIISQRISSVHL